MMIRFASRALLSGIVCWLALAGPAPAQTYVQRHEAARVLHSGNLYVEVMDPGAPGRYNTGARFSPLANVLRAVLNGKDYLFSPVEHDPAMENCGLAMEFDIDTPGGPSGYVEAAIGEPYLKVGVGVMSKESEKYDFSKPGVLLRRAPVTVKWGQDRASFEQVSENINGYAYKLTAQIVVKEPAIEISYRLDNSGVKSLTSEQYAHNYFCFSGAPIGPNYEVTFPYPIDPTFIVGKKPRWEGQTIFYDETASKPVNIRIPTPMIAWTDNSVTVRNSANGQEIKAETITRDAQLARTFLHASQAYLSPEQFVLFCLEPGASAQWTRRYELSQKVP